MMTTTALSTFSSYSINLLIETEILPCSDTKKLAGFAAQFRKSETCSKTGYFFDFWVLALCGFKRRIHGFHQTLRFVEERHLGAAGLQIDFSSRLIHNFS